MSKTHSPRVQGASPQRAEIKVTSGGFCGNKINENALKTTGLTMITTSYYAQEKKIKNPVRISQQKYRWGTKSREYMKLAPPMYLVNHWKKGSITVEQYTEEYYRVVLSKLNPQEVLDEIIRIFGDDATLLCFEKAGEFCHRRLVAEWIEKGTGVEVPELQF